LGAVRSVSAPEPGVILKALDAIPDPGGAPADYAPLPVIIVRSGEMVKAFVNVCPHQGRPLCLPSGKTLISEARYLVCPFHGASFDIETGACAGGPAGKAGLKPIPVAVRDGMVVAV